MTRSRLAERVPSSFSAEDGWSPDVVEVLKGAAADAGLPVGLVRLAFLGDDKFGVTKFDGSRTIVVGLRHTAEGEVACAYWRETPRVSPIARFLGTPGRVPLPAEPTSLPDGTLGYFVPSARTDDCFAAAIATVLQVPLADVPDPRIDERLAVGEAPEEIDRFAQDELNRWLSKRGLRLVVHRELPTRRARWIGVVPGAGSFNDHCLVMSRDEVLFDPGRVSTGVRSFGLEDVRIGLSFQSIKSRR